MLLQGVLNRVKALRSVIKPRKTLKPVMDITAINFDEKLPYLESSIEDAIFVAVDTEFTGLSIEDQKISSLDTLEERYEKIRTSTSKFLMIQFGLSTFHYDMKKNSYSNRTFNFYVWPKRYHRQAPDRRFICQASSIDFLAQVRI